MGSSSTRNILFFLILLFFNCFVTSEALGILNLNLPVGDILNSLVSINKCGEIKDVIPLLDNGFLFGKDTNCNYTNSSPYSKKAPYVVFGNYGAKNTIKNFLNIKATLDFGGQVLINNQYTLQLQCNSDAIDCFKSEMLNVTGDVYSGTNSKLSIGSFYLYKGSSINSDKRLTINSDLMYSEGILNFNSDSIFNTPVELNGGSVNFNSGNCNLNSNVNAKNNSIISSKSNVLSKILNLYNSKYNNNGGEIKSDQLNLNDNTCAFQSNGGNIQATTITNNGQMNLVDTNTKYTGLKVNADSKIQIQGGTFNNQGIDQDLDLVGELSMTGTSSILNHKTISLGQMLNLKDGDCSLNSNSITSKSSSKIISNNQSFKSTSKVFQAQEKSLLDCTNSNVNFEASDNLLLKDQSQFQFKAKSLFNMNGLVNLKDSSIISLDSSDMVHSNQHIQISDSSQLNVASNSNILISSGLNIFNGGIFNLNLNSNGQIKNNTLVALNDNSTFSVSNASKLSISESSNIQIKNLSKFNINDKSIVNLDQTVISVDKQGSFNSQASKLVFTGNSEAHVNGEFKLTSTTMESDGTKIIVSGSMSLADGSNVKLHNGKLTINDNGKLDLVGSTFTNNNEILSSGEWNIDETSYFANNGIITCDKNSKITSTNAGDDKFVLNHGMWSMNDNSASLKKFENYGSLRTVNSQLQFKDLTVYKNSELKITTSNIQLENDLIHQGKIHGSGNINGNVIANSDAILGDTDSPSLLRIKGNMVHSIDTEFNVYISGNATEGVDYSKFIIESDYSISDSGSSVGSMESNLGVGKFLQADSGSKSSNNNSTKDVNLYIKDKNVSGTIVFANSTKFNTGNIEFKFKIKVYDPNTKQYVPIQDDCKYKLQRNVNSLGVVISPFNSCEVPIVESPSTVGAHTGGDFNGGVNGIGGNGAASSNPSPTTQAQLVAHFKKSYIGLALGCVGGVIGFAIIVGVLIWKNRNIKNFIKLKRESFFTRMNSSNSSLSSYSV
ncbi:hypothetical protein CYY_006935 [Polysphondylium violaceum]|uniref:Transmembrane protein n=1 Tax=Polysphondylium violaceum TaxID=133409 RepID=A0A8J4PRP7_9MYCE|nr:hypothetical protein CYY_006935 [Polysphondylium violaceum]